MSRAGEIFDVTINMVRDQLPHHRRLKTTEFFVNAFI